VAHDPLRWKACNGFGQSPEFFLAHTRGRLLDKIDIALQIAPIAWNLPFRRF